MFNFIKLIPFIFFLARKKNEQMTFNEILDKTDNEIITLYLDYVNNFLSVLGFAMRYNLNEVDAHYIIELGRKLNNELSKNK